MRTRGVWRLKNCTFPPLRLNLATERQIAKALAYEDKYEWEQARGSYHETMELDSAHAEAKEGYFRTGRMIRTLMQYNKLVDVAESLARPEMLDLSAYLAQASGTGSMVGAVCTAGRPTVATSGWW